MPAYHTSNRSMSATTSPVSLLRSSHHSAGAAPVPAYPPPHLPFSEFPWLLLPDGTIDQAPRPTLCLICLPFTLVSLACTRAAYVKGLSRLSSPPVSLACRGLCPGPLTTIAMAFLVDIDSFLSARTSQERRTMHRVGGLRCRCRHGGKNHREEMQARWWHSSA